MSAHAAIHYPALGLGPGETSAAVVRTELHRATLGLAETAPQFSARRVVTHAQVAFFAAFVLVFTAGLAAYPERVADLIVGLMSLGFLEALMVRCGLAVLGARAKVIPPPACDHELPLYSILVPVYHEAGMIAQMAAALRGLDYPAGRLDILMVVEQDDRETLLAVRAAGLKAVVVPPGLPRTKPKACNYALSFARGEFVVVYDAEDRPEPDQLKKAVAAFRTEPGISCFQARLTVDRARRWISQMFALDYAVWFGTLLPGLSRLKAPIPLGGTSNHFRTAALIEAGAWDPYNVTEDADLGLRLARLGYRVGILDSATFEEAPPRLSTWTRQRTRWMKGYMQTLLVHGRNPGAVVGELGPRGVLLIWSFLGGAVWSALINPVMWVFCIVSAFFAGDGDWLALMARISGLTLFFGNGMLAMLAMVRGGRRLGDAAIVVTYPLYWLLVSAATYRALWQLFVDPFHWEKTPHGAAEH